MNPNSEAESRPADAEQDRLLKLYGQRRKERREQKIAAAKATRTVAIIEPPRCDDGVFVMRIAVTTPRKAMEPKLEEDDYEVRPIPSDFGIAFRVRKLCCTCNPQVADDGEIIHAEGCGENAEAYDVCLDSCTNGQQNICSCMAYSKSNYCRHLAALLALIKTDKLKLKLKEEENL